MRKSIDVHERLPFFQMVPLGLQHLFAMFGATVLVPILTGLSPAVALFTSGTGTLIFIFITQGKVPAYLGSSFAFIAPITAVAAAHGLPYDWVVVLIVGIIYGIVAFHLPRGNRLARSNAATSCNRFNYHRNWSWLGSYCRKYGWISGR